MLDETIAAVATPFGRGGIGVIRLSGPDAAAVARRVVRSANEILLAEPNVAVLADVFLPETPEVPLDQAVVMYFRAPRSYTGDDVVEIACHGSPVVLQTALNAILRSGARLATPGEFSLRAFLNGKVDLTQAEAVRDLIDAQTAHQARVAQRQLRGALSTRLAPLKERLLHLIVQLESSVEFVEDDISPQARASLAVELAAAAEDLNRLTASYELGRLVAQGASVALVGPPNAGKSSLFNALIEDERAIVTAVPGTTRDLVSESVVVSGVPLRFVDTAGLRESEDVVERIGVTRTRGAIADADVVLLVLDAAETPRDEIERLLAETADSGKRLVVFNKIDLESAPTHQLFVEGSVGEAAILVSARARTNVDALRARIGALVAGTGASESDAILVTNARHHALLAAAAGHLESARDALVAGYSEEIALVGLHAGLRELGEITGETAINDILHRIFSTFCIGK